MNLFPSPIGELHFSIFVSNLYDISQPIVSVPYRGATFLNLYHEIRQKKRSAGFRPLSGSYISQ